jgi:hypothetical protein
MELSRAARLQPGASLVPIAQTLMPSALTLGGQWSGTIPVALFGANRWRDVSGNVALQLNYVNLAPLEPTELFFSDDPEEVKPTQTGVLFRQEVQPKTAVRVYEYSQLDSPGQLVYLILHSQGRSHVQLLGDMAGPGYYDAAGHKATLRYLMARRSQRSIVSEVSADSPLFIPIGGPATDVPRVVTAIYDIGLLDGDPIDVLIAAAHIGDDLSSLPSANVTPAFEDTHERFGVYPLDAEPPIMLSASIGMLFAAPPDGMSVRVGSWAVPPINGKRYLIGDFGIVRPLRLTLTNVTARPAQVYLYESPPPNGATATLLFDDMPAPIELPCLQPPGDYLIRAFTVPPGGSPLEVTGTFMTDGGSEYPTVLGLSYNPPTLPPPTRECTAASK